MAYRNFGLDVRNYTTAQLSAIVAQYGPAGATDITGIKPGTLVFDTTAAKLKMFDGTNFVLVTGSTPALTSVDGGAP